MNQKHFILTPQKTGVSKKEIDDIEADKISRFKIHAQNQDKKNLEKLKQQSELKCVHNRIIVTVDMKSKNWHTFADGTKIYRGREFNNFDRKYTHPVNTYVISSEEIPMGAELLVHPNALYDDNKIFGYREDETDVRYYSVPITQCYLWRMGSDNWHPLKGFVTALRVFKPYEGNVIGIKPMQIKNILYITVSLPYPVCPALYQEL